MEIRNPSAYLASLERTADSVVPMFLADGAAIKNPEAYVAKCEEKVTQSHCLIQKGRRSGTLCPTSRKPNRKMPELKSWQRKRKGKLHSDSHH
jgi:hypothetical protein